ncbi:MAG TPA: MFS transporter, partial [Allocoleopsis sp.]
MNLVGSPDFQPVVKKLSHRTKLAYGVGEVSRAAIQNIRVVFLLYFLTNVAGLNAALAGTLLLIGRIWDGINDPIVGWLSDRTRSRWGKRYPWIVGGSVPLAVFSVLQWVVPHFSQSDHLNQL